MAPKNRLKDSVRLKLSEIHKVKKDRTRVDRKGRTLYYELGGKSETISPTKRILLVDWGNKNSSPRIYPPDVSRAILGWKKSDKYNKSDIGDFTKSVFVESKSHNRMFKAGQNYLLGTPKFKAKKNKRSGGTTKSGPVESTLLYGNTRETHKRFESIKEPRGGSTSSQAEMKAMWSGTSREGIRLAVSYAPSGRAKCKECEGFIAKGALRLTKIVPNPFDSYAGETDFQQHYHMIHGFQALDRVRCSTKVPSKASQIQGLKDLKAKDRKHVEQKFDTFLARHKQKCAAAAAKGKRK